MGVPLVIANKRFDPVADLYRVYNIGNASLCYWEFTQVVKKIVLGMQIELQPEHGSQHRPSAYMVQDPYQRRSGISPRLHDLAGR